MTDAIHNLPHEDHHQNIWSGLEQQWPTQTPRHNPGYAYVFQFSRLQSLQSLDFFIHCLYASSSSALNSSSACALFLSASRNSGIAGPSMAMCIKVLICSGVRRHRSEDRILFITEKERLLLALPIGSSSIFFAISDNVGNMATTSAWWASLTRNYCVKISGSLVRIL